MKLRLPFGRPLLFFGLASISFNAYSQKPLDAEEVIKQKLASNPQVRSFEISDERKTPSFVAFKKGTQTYSSNGAKTVLSNLLSLRAGLDELKEVRQVNGTSGFSVVEFQQYYKGIKVEHSRYTGLVKNGEIRFFNGAYYNVPANIALSPKIPETNALGKAKESVRAKKYAWENLEEII